MNEAPTGSLTPAQFELLEAAWTAGEAGATVAEIWAAVAVRRAVARTTVLNLVDRLAERGWLVRRSYAGTAAKYVPALDRESARRRLTGEFVADFFGGDATRLVQTLLGAEELADADLGSLRQLLADAEARRRDRKPEEGL